MRPAIALLLVCLAWLPALGGGAPAGIPTQPPAALVLEDPGGTSFGGLFSFRDARLSVSRSVCDRVDVAVLVTPDCPFDLRLRVLLVRDVVPLRVEAEVAAGHALLLGSLHLGPVRADAARAWGKEAGGWCVVRLAARADVSFVVGARFACGSILPVAGFSWRPSTRALWSLTALFDGSGPAIAVGGVG
ncbi:MAG: hypothetical protein PHU43_06790 [Candidatus Bipolaricaulis sp.]|nr:hypothetical protein [Candidatus Bipolaricaulis sp.]